MHFIADTMLPTSIDILSEYSPRTTHIITNYLNCYSICSFCHLFYDCSDDNRFSVYWHYFLTEWCPKRSPNLPAGMRNNTIANRCAWMSRPISISLSEKVVPINGEAIVIAAIIK
jgi:hypothetical protein